MALEPFSFFAAVSSSRGTGRAQPDPSRRPRRGHSPGHRDIIIHDALNAPVLFKGKTAVVPIESVYGIIEVKSSLSKTELLDTLAKIQAFKRLAPRDLSVIQTREYVTVHRPFFETGSKAGIQAQHAERLRLI